MTRVPMVRAAVLAVVLVALPAVASAQRGGGGRGMGSKDADWKAVAGDSPKGPSISGKDFVEASPLAMLLDKKKQLKLTDAQVTGIKAADEKLQAANKERYLLVDSLKKQMRPSVAPSAEDEARLAVARESMQGVVRDIRASHDADTKEVVATLDADQQKTATELLEKHQEKVQKMLQDKLGTRPGGGGGPGRRGPGTV
ncbi:hypothetical protein [Gemmatimonas aurantiaca]|uniref:hypothetical protein n=1 Tax=Gemmatimonas aurantiaca TaxID=173480 RepID=UPI00301C8827